MCHMRRRIHVILSLPNLLEETHINMYTYNIYIHTHTHTYKDLLSGRSHAHLFEEFDLLNGWRHHLQRLVHGTHLDTLCSKEGEYINKKRRSTHICALFSLVSSHMQRLVNGTHLKIPAQQRVCQKKPTKRPAKETTKETYLET